MNNFDTRIIKKQRRGFCSFKRFYDIRYAGLAEILVVYFRYSKYRRLFYFRDNLINKRNILEFPIKTYYLTFISKDISKYHNIHTCNALYSFSIIGLNEIIHKKHSLLKIKLTKKKTASGKYSRF